MSRKSRKGLTALEINILQLLWEKNTPLLRNEILENLPAQDFNPVSLFGVLNSMVERGFLQVEGKYNKVYQVAISQEEYAMSQLSSLTSNLSPSQRISSVLSFFLDHEDVDLDTVRELEEMLHHYRKEHEEL